MRYLVVYDGAASKLIRILQFGQDETLALDVAYASAEAEYLLNGREVEIVVLEADSREALATTHGRYFRTLAELGQAYRDDTEADRKTE